MKNLLPHHGTVCLYENLFSKHDADHLHEKLKLLSLWQQQEILIFGKKIMQPRLTAFCGEPGVHYSYSGIQMQASPWPEDVLFIKQAVEKLTQHKFNAALLNYYRHGQDSMGWHRDNEKELGLHPVIASVSFGAQRIFKMREYKTKENTIDIELTNGSLLVMKGETQTFWEHALPKTKKVSDTRINLTFRFIEN